MYIDVNRGGAKVPTEIFREEIHRTVSVSCEYRHYASQNAL